MKIAIYSLVLGFALLLSSCETEPDIYIPSKPQPVIHAIFDDHDSIHYILVTKTFGAAKSSQDFRSIYDSIYFDEVNVEVMLKEQFTDSWIPIIPERVFATGKEAGLFHYPDQEDFCFNRIILDTPSHPLLRTTFSIDSISVRVSIPGYEDAYCLVKRIDSVDIVAPLFDQTYLYLVPSSPLLFIWSGHAHAWSEFDVEFEFIEELETGYRSKWVVIQNTQYDESAFSQYRQLNVTYEEFIREVLLQIDNDPAVIRRYIGYVKMHIVGGDQPMVEYMKYFNGYTDYNEQGYTNITNGLGVIATSTRFSKDSMRFDYETRQTLINENRLKKLRICKWSSPEEALYLP